VRALRIALATGVLFATPAVIAEPLPPQSPHQPQPPKSHVASPMKRPHPAPTPRHPYRPHDRNNARYPVIIDGSVVDRYLVTPAPPAKRTATPRPKNNGQDVFETHASDDAK
jgi:hypothetical protein